MMDRELDILEWLGLDPFHPGGWTTRLLVRMLCRWFEGWSCWFIAHHHNHSTACLKRFDGYLEDLMTSGFFEKQVSLPEVLPEFWSRSLGQNPEIDRRMMRLCVLQEPPGTGMIVVPQAVECRAENIPLFFGPPRLTPTYTLGRVCGHRHSKRMLFLDNHYVEKIVESCRPFGVGVQLLDIIGGYDG